MISLKRKESGFTIVELLIVIVVIGILAALVITTFSGIQKKARDTERTTDIKALHGQIEAYFAQNGYYPDLSNVTTTDLKGLDAGALVDPKGGSLVAGAGDASHYGYAPSKDDGTACTTAAKDCTKYVLTATLEGGGTFVKNSLN
jgi:prepilin-type N-terminal cleavage/methylation domain-containing protein